MSKARRSRKERSEHSRSERSKYLETMMADMGLASITDLKSNEERQRWLKASRPSAGTERKLREMGYDISGNTNKRSLGSRLDRVYSFKKTADRITAARELTSAMKDLREVVNEDCSYEIISIMNAHNFLTHANFDPILLKSKLDIAVNTHMGSTAEYLYYIQNLVDKATRYNSEYMASVNTSPEGSASGGEAAGSDSYNPDDIEHFFRDNPNISIGRNYPDRDQVRYIQYKLQELGYTLDRLGANGAYDEETEEAVILFQHYNGIPTTGVVDGVFVQKLLNNPTRMPRDSRRTHRRRVREENREVPGGSEEQATGEAPAFQNVQYTSSRVDISGATAMLREYLNILNQAAVKLGGIIQITSAFRDSYNQSRIMYSNYSRRGVGSNRANSYLTSLYRRFQKIDEIVAIFAGSQSDSEKIREVETIIENNWLPKTGHRAGYSIDVRFGDKVREILEETQNLATVDILRESDHFHVTVKSLTPGGIPSGTVRRFNS